MKFLHCHHGGALGMRYGRMVGMAEGEAKQPDLATADKTEAGEINKILQGQDGKDGLQKQVEDFKKIDTQDSKKQHFQLLDAHRDESVRLTNTIAALDARILAFFKEKQVESAPMPKLDAIRETLKKLQKSVDTANTKFESGMSAIAAKRREAEKPVADKAANVAAKVGSTVKPGGPAADGTPKIEVTLSDSAPVENTIEKNETLTPIADALYREASSLKSILPVIISDSKYNVVVSNTKLTVNIFDAIAQKGSTPKNTIILPINDGRYVFKLQDPGSGAGGAERRIKDPVLAIKGVAELVKKAIGKEVDQKVFDEIIKISGNDTGIDVVKAGSGPLEQVERPAETSKKEADILFKANRFADALNKYIEMAKVAKGEPGEHYPYALLQQGVCQMNLGEKQKAYNAFAEAAKVAGDRSLPQLKKQAEGRQAIAAFSMKKYDEAKTLLSNDVENDDPKNADSYATIRAELKKMDDKKLLESFENAEGRKKVVAVLNGAAAKLETLKNGTELPSQLKKDKKAQLNTEIDGLLPLLKNSDYGAKRTLKDLMATLDLNGKEDEFMKKNDDNERMTMIYDVLLKKAVAKANSAIVEMKDAAGPSIRPVAIDDGEAAAAKKAAEAQATKEAEAKQLAAQKEAAKSEDRKILDTIDSVDGKKDKILKTNDTVFTEEKIAKKDVVEKLNALTTDTSLKIDSGALLSKVKYSNLTDAEKGTLSVSQDLFIRAIIRFQISQKAESLDGILTGGLLGVLMKSEAAKVASPPVPAAADKPAPPSAPSAVEVRPAEPATIPATKVEPAAAPPPAAPDASPPPVAESAPKPAETPGTPLPKAEAAPATPETRDHVSISSSELANLRREYESGRTTDGKNIDAHSQAVFAQVMDAIEASRRDGKAHELVQAGLTGWTILDKKNQPITVEVYGQSKDASGNITGELIRFKYANEEIKDIKLFIAKINADATFSTFSGADNAALAAQRERMFPGEKKAEAPMRNSIGDEIKMLDGSIRNDNPEFKKIDTKLVKAIQSAYQRALDNKSPWPVITDVLGSDVKVRVVFDASKAGPGKEPVSYSIVGSGVNLPAISGTLDFLKQLRVLAKVPEVEVKAAAEPAPEPKPTDTVDKAGGVELIPLRGKIETLKKDFTIDKRNGFDKKDPPDPNREYYQISFQNPDDIDDKITGWIVLVTNPKKKTVYCTVSNEKQSKKFTADELTSKSLKEWLISGNTTEKAIKAQKAAEDAKRQADEAEEARLAAEKTAKEAQEAAENAVEQPKLDKTKEYITKNSKKITMNGLINLLNKDLTAEARITGEGDVKKIVDAIAQLQKKLGLKITDPNHYGIFGKRTYAKLTQFDKTAKATLKENALKSDAPPPAAPKGPPGVAGVQPGGAAEVGAPQPPENAETFDSRDKVVAKLYDDARKNSGNEVLKSTNTADWQRALDATQRLVDDMNQRDVKNDLYYKNLVRLGTVQIVLNMPNDAKKNIDLAKAYYADKIGDKYERPKTVLAKLLKKLNEKNVV